jgi:hypothetical protein
MEESRVDLTYRDSVMWRRGGDFLPGPLALPRRLFILSHALAGRNATRLERTHALYSPILLGLTVPNLLTPYEVQQKNHHRLRS